MLSYVHQGDLEASILLQNALLLDNAASAETFIFRRQNLFIYLFLENQRFPGRRLKRPHATNLSFPLEEFLL